MEQRSPLIFKIANEDWEFDLIHQLNYKTFVEEIPQHAPSPTQRLVDKFHSENTYLICLSGRKLAGMLAARSKRPFSLDQKIANLDSYLPAGRSFCEIRLLSVDKKFRTGQVFQGLMSLMWQHFVEHGYDMGLISGTTRQSKLYKHLGFIPFGPLVGSEGAQYQPMYLSIESFEAGVREFLSARAPRHVQRPMVNFLPGPVAISRHVRRAFEAAPESHRSDGFIADFQATKQLLCELTSAKNVEILLGSGTLANDVVAAQLSPEKKKGMIVTNGEFGERLVDHARRFGLDFELIQYPWGKSFDLANIRQKINSSAPTWLWCAHCETSAGIVNDLETLKSICSENDTKLCIDAISSIGTMPVQLEGIYLASCASGKGLRSFPGLGMVFYNHELAEAAGSVPRYLDLELYAKSQGIAFTHSSNLLHALNAAIKKVSWPERFSELAETSTWLRNKLREIGFGILGSDKEASPAVVTIVLPPELSSTKVGGQLQEAGFLLSCNSEYLRQKNLIQICIMGEFTREKLVSLLNHLNRICFRRSQAAVSTKNLPTAES
ncbi:MAG: serine-pyruvate aminotransferase/archaeal aspartate aminotransferase [Pedosphaera sp.]|nr:serine-pyruvate aminotransferase/archaeal aspartate aminotransferase [Pedosphaera sp.]